MSCLSAVPFHCRTIVGSKLTPTSNAAATPALLDSPMDSNICGNLYEKSAPNVTGNPFERRCTYQNGPIKPHICLTKVMKTPILAASS